MSIKLMAQLWDNDDPELSGPRLLIMLCLADHANDDGYCFPSIERIAKRARIQNRNAMRYIQELETAGYLKVNRISGKHNSYVVSATRGKFTTSDNFTTGDKNTMSPVVNSTGTRGKITTPPVVKLPPEPSLPIREEPPEEPSREGPAPKPEPDPTLKDPAVIAFRNRTHITPDPEWRKRIAAIVTDYARWDNTIIDWLGSGWNKRNVKGMLEVYESGPRLRNNGREPKPDPKLEALRMLEEEDPSG